MFGQGTPDPSDSQDGRTSPTGTGVLGLGRFHGVYGVAANVDIKAAAPDLSHFSPMGSGVIGANQSLFLMGGSNGSPAILGLNDLQDDDFNILSHDPDHPPKSLIALKGATQEPIAVAGLSRAGHGVCGLSLNLFDRTIDVPGPSVGATLRGDIGPDLLTKGLTETTQAAGVIGIAMTGPGLRGVSHTDRGAIFQSATDAAENEVDPSLGVPPAPVAQIRLVPYANLQVKEPPLPAAGKIGDLLALATIDPNRQIRADLWFCVGIDSDTLHAVWGKLAFSQTVIGTES